ncbi:MAG: helix-hairpin-helix domain-containing protein [Clostridia bacterium]|nr:helix-hairpin-helix domain-containing protein [Clostridia bacterium]
MSDKAKRMTGVLLVLTGVVLSLAHILAPVHNDGIVYRTGCGFAWQLSGIPVKEAGIVRINTAGEDELETLPGIGKVYALQLIEERNKNGPFYYPEDLTAVHGIGNRTVKKLYQYINLTVE